MANRFRPQESWRVEGSGSYSPWARPEGMYDAQYFGQYLPEQIKSSPERWASEQATLRAEYERPWRSAVQHAMDEQQTAPGYSYGRTMAQLGEAPRDNTFAMPKMTGNDMTTPIESPEITKAQLEALKHQFPHLAGTIAAYEGIPRAANRPARKAVGSVVRRIATEGLGLPAETGGAAASVAGQGLKAISKYGVPILNYLFANDIANMAEDASTWLQTRDRNKPAYWAGENRQVFKASPQNILDRINALEGMLQQEQYGRVLDK